MTAPAPEQRDSAEEQWRAILLNPSPYLRVRRLFARIPSAPRCKFCAVPFAGPGGLILPRLGWSRWPHNPKYCRRCFAMLSTHHGGAEIECSLLFADVRGSTTLAEGMPPRDFNRLMGRFSDTALAILVEHDAYVDKFVGDEVIAIFVPAMTGKEHARRAVDAGLALLRATGNAGNDEAWVPIGIGVNTGTAYVGSVGEGLDADLTAMGDVVNVTARLATVAGAGEMLVTADAARAAAVSGDAEQRSLLLKGKSGPTDVLVLRA
jgi:adenylate cyclase